MKKVFIQTNTRQLLGARLAKYAIERSASEPIPVEIMHVNEIDAFKKYDGTEYHFGKGEYRTYRLNDLQSFTLSRFMPPELMNYNGTAIVIDPDIFALSDLNELFALDMKDAAIACCKKKDAWDTSVMLLDCAKLRRWSIENIMKRLAEKQVDYMSVMTLKEEKAVIEIPRVWNSLDALHEDTKMLHTTDRLTQPWSTGLPIDFTRNKMPKLFGIIPREPIHKLLGKYPSTYQPHPNKNIDDFYFNLLKDALKDSAVIQEDLEKEVVEKKLRPDIFEILAKT